MSDHKCPVCVAKESLQLPEVDRDVIGTFVNNYVDSLLKIVERPSQGYCKVHSSPENAIKDFCNIPLSDYRLSDKAKCIGCNAKPSDTKTYCFKCKGFLCLKCLEIHQKGLRFMKEHSGQYYPWREIENTLKKLCETEVNNECQDHEGEVIVLVCKDCDYKAMCVKCSHNSEHREHTNDSLMFVTQAVKESKATFDKNLQEITNVSEMVNEIDNHINNQIQCKKYNHGNKPPLFMCTNCENERVCINCIETGHIGHTFTTVIKLQSGEVKNLTKLNARAMCRRNDSVLNTMWTRFTEVLREQGNESKMKILQHKWLTTVLKCIFETSIWTHVKFLPRIQRCLDKFISESRFGNYRCGNECVNCDRLNDSKVIKGRIGCQEILRRFDCQSTNTIYVMTCDICEIQFVGETGQQLKKRISKEKDGKCAGCGESKWSIAAVFQTENEEERMTVKTALMLKLGTLNVENNIEILRNLPVSPLCKGMNKQCCIEKVKCNLSKINEYFTLDGEFFLVQVAEREERRDQN